MPAFPVIPAPRPTPRSPRPYPCASVKSVVEKSGFIHGSHGFPFVLFVSFVVIPGYGISRNFLTTDYAEYTDLKAKSFGGQAL